MDRIVHCENPCPCGYHGDPVKECTCSLTPVLRYQKRISGPLLDRIDIHIDMRRVEYDKLTSERMGETSAQIRARVARAGTPTREGVLSDSHARADDCGPRGL